MGIFDDAVFWLCIAGMVVGLAGSVLPALPGVPMIFISALVYAYLTDFEIVGGWVVGFIGLLAALALVADFVGTSYGARRFGASGWGTAGGAIGGVMGALVGLLFVGIGALFGLILGSIGGVFLGEYLRRRRGGNRPASGTAVPETTGSAQDSGDWRRVSRAAGGVLVGYAISAVAQAALGVIGFVVFLVAVFN